jgi:hypothetical protein
VILWSAAVTKGYPPPSAIASRACSQCWSGAVEAFMPVLWAVRNESGHRVALNPRAPEAAEAALYEAVYGYPNRPAVRFDVSAGFASASTVSAGVPSRAMRWSWENTAWQ